MSAVLDRLLAAVNAHDPEALTWCYSPWATVWPTDWPVPAPAREWLVAVPVILTRFPDLQLERVATASEGSLTVAELRMSATDRGTGGALIADGVVVVESDGDLVVRERHYWRYGDPAATRGTDATAPVSPPAAAVRR